MPLFKVSCAKKTKQKNRNIVRIVHYNSSLTVPMQKIVHYVEVCLFFFNIVHRVQTLCNRHNIRLSTSGMCSDVYLTDRSGRFATNSVDAVFAFLCIISPFLSKTLVKPLCTVFTSSASCWFNLRTMTFMGAPIQFPLIALSATRPIPQQSVFFLFFFVPPFF